MDEVKYVAGQAIRAGDFLMFSGNRFARDGEMIQLVVPAIRDPFGAAARHLSNGETIRYDPLDNTKDVVIRGSLNATTGRIDPEKPLPLP